MSKDISHPSVISNIFLRKRPDASNRDRVCKRVGKIATVKQRLVEI